MLDWNNIRSREKPLNLAYSNLNIWIPTSEIFLNLNKSSAVIQQFWLKKQEL